MNTVTFIATALLAAAACLPASAADQVIFVPKDKVAASMAAEGGGPLAKGSDYSVQMGMRTKPGEVEVHANETDTMYVLEGGGTIVTGGKVVGGKTTAPGQIRGTSITGGTSQKLTKGDVMTVPKGTPHWFKEIDGHITYYVVKSIH